MDEGYWLRFSVLIAAGGTIVVASIIYDIMFTYGLGCLICYEAGRQSWVVR